MSTKAPEHVAIIMDGNGRWANRQNAERVRGHRAGALVVREIVTHARERGVRYLTLFAFSSENWARPEQEVASLMELLGEYLVEERSTMLKNGIRLRSIGASHRLPPEIQSLLEMVCEDTKDQNDMDLVLALSYGARDEIVRAANALAAAGKEINEENLSRKLDTRAIPDPDLVIRTSGEIRLSNFLLWQAAYSELYFTDVPWPAFTKEDFDLALSDFERRKRRFGMTDAQMGFSTQGNALSDKEAS